MTGAALAAEILGRIGSLSSQSVPHLRALRRAYSARLAGAPRNVVVAAAGSVAKAGFPSVGFELVRFHSEALARLRPPEVDALGRGLDSWAAVDCFGIFVSGPAWRLGRIKDSQVHRWTRSPDRWRRRAALVSTVPLNSRVHGGRGDIGRTLGVCRRLAADRDPMVVKALSWALRELAKWEPAAVRSYLATEGGRHAAQVRREVRNKLETGLKNPRRR